MKIFRFAVDSVLAIVCSAAVLTGAGCASSGGGSSSGKPATAATTRYKAADGRNVEIGKATVANSGLSYRNPRMEKCWTAAEVNFADYDTLYIAPTLSTAKYQKDEEILHSASKENLVRAIAQMARDKQIFANVVTRESEIKPGARVLKLENTITEYAKGGGAARYFVGLYGGGQPVLRVQGNVTDAAKPVMAYEMRRSGVSGGARMTGAFMKDEDIQNEDIRSLATDLTDFFAAKAGKYQAKN